MALEDIPKQLALNFVLSALRGRMKKVILEIRNGSRDYEMGTRVTEHQREAVAEQAEKIIDSLAKSVVKRMR